MSARRRLIFAAVALAYWSVYLVLVLAAVIAGEHPIWLVPLAVVGGVVALGAAGVVLRWWPSTTRLPAVPQLRLTRPVIGGWTPPTQPAPTRATAPVRGFAAPPGRRGLDVTQFLVPVYDGSSAAAAAPPVAVADPEPAPAGDPTGIRDFGTFLDVREGGYEEGYDVGYGDGTAGRPHRNHEGSDPGAQDPLQS